MVSKFAEEKVEKMISRYENGVSATQIANDMDLHTTSITRVLNRNGIETGYKRGENHPGWKGGRIEKGDNHIGIHKPDHPRADSQGYVYEHTLVMEQKIGRLPQGKEQVHHINLDKKDNRPENLFLVDDKSQHGKIHKSIENLIPELLERDIVSFDRDKKRYVLNE